jgi:hypothetical protein
LRVDRLGHGSELTTPLSASRFPLSAIRYELPLPPPGCQAMEPESG